MGSDTARDEVARIAARLAGIADPIDFLARLFANSPFGIQVYSADGHCVLVNQAFLRLFGSEPPPEYDVRKDDVAARSGVLDLINRAFAGETIEVPATWYDPRELQQVRVEVGRRVAIKAAAFPLQGAGRTVEHVVFVFEDVTREMEEAAARRASEERYRRFVETAAEGVWEIDAEGRTTFANARMEDLVGAAPGTLIGRSYRDLLFPEDVAAADAIRGEHRRGVATPVDFRLRRFDGRPVWATFANTAVFDDEGRYTGTFSMVTDVTERRAADAALRESERRWRRLVENGIDVVLLVAADGGITWASEAIRRVLGRAPDEVERLTAADLVHPEDLDVALAAVATATACPGEACPARWRMRHADGGWRIMEGTITSRLTDPDVGAVVVNQHDITDRVALEEQVRQAVKMEAVGQLAGGIAHDFNNVLSVIVGFAGLARRRMSPDAPGAAEIERIAEAANRAAALTRRLLAISRRQVVQPRAVDPAEVLRELAPMLAAVAGERIALVLETPPVPPVRIDPGQLEQVVLNLAVNARDAMPKGGTLTIALAPEGDDIGDGVRLTVSDTGVGMDEDVRARIFEPFFTTKPAGSGTGLGLASVRGIVEEAGGRVTVSSEPGAGTTFTIALPRTEGRPAATVAAPSAEALRGDETILVVEDEPGVRRFVREALERQGYHVLLASDPDEAVEVASRAPGLDLLLSDVIMPRRSGADLAQELRRARPDLRVLLMSGFAEAGPGEGVGGFELVEKPLDVDTLARRIRHVLDA